VLLKLKRTALTYCFTTLVFISFSLGTTPCENCAKREWRAQCDERWNFPGKKHLQSVWQHHLRTDCLERALPRHWTVVQCIKHISKTIYQQNILNYNKRHWVHKHLISKLHNLCSNHILNNSKLWNNWRTNNKHLYLSIKTSH